MNLKAVLIVKGKSKSWMRSQMLWTGQSKSQIEAVWQLARVASCYWAASRAAGWAASQADGQVGVSSKSTVNPWGWHGKEWLQTWMKTLRSIPHSSDIFFWRKITFLNSSFFKSFWKPFFLYWIAGISTNFQLFLFLLILTAVAEQKHLNTYYY